jgi:hypothetical protein
MAPRDASAWCPKYMDKLCEALLEEHATRVACLVAQAKERVDVVTARANGLMDDLQRARALHGANRATLELGLLRALQIEEDLVNEALSDLAWCEELHRRLERLREDYDGAIIHADECLVRLARM